MKYYCSECGGEIPIETKEYETIRYKAEKGIAEVLICLVCQLLKLDRSKE